MADFDTRELERLLLELGDPMETLELRESLSNLAGMLLAGTLEGIAIHGVGQHLLPPVEKAYAAVTQALEERAGTRAQAKSSGWAFIRTGGSFPDNHPNYAQLRAFGAGGALWDPDDVNAAAGIASSREAGFETGIWLVPHEKESPEAFARRTDRMITKLMPDLVALDIQAIGKGYEGSPGWRWSDEMMNALTRLQPPPLAVTVEPLQDNFNYAAYTNRRAAVWPQSYTDDMTPCDPQTVIDRVVSNGVPRDLVVPVLGPAQLDDYHGPHNIDTAADVQSRAQTVDTNPTDAGHDPVQRVRSETQARPSPP